MRQKGGSVGFFQTTDIGDEHTWPRSATPYVRGSVSICRCSAAPAKRLNRRVPAWSEVKRQGISVDTVYRIGPVRRQKTYGIKHGFGRQKLTPYLTSIFVHTRGSIRLRAIYPETIVGVSSSVFGAPVSVKVFRCKKSFFTKKQISSETL